jgi:sterol desaturase/sphingolipid hydroxylase (fatty acid hydroxylase superfamily)
MHVELLGSILGKIAETVWGLLPSALVFAVAFSALSLFASQACNPGRTWWRNPGLFTDICYLVIIPFVAPYMRLSLMIVAATLLAGVMSAHDVADYFARGLGPLAGLPFWAQVAFYLVVSDFLLYWSHRLFHGNAMWRYHAIHHSAEEVDWTTAYRFHPVNLWLGSFLVTAIMICCGISPAVLLFLVPFDTTTAAFVHANLNWTLGPLKYVVATPVFHRWHHTPLEEGGSSNFGSLFAIWDVLFGTFYMPSGQLPASYGIGDPEFPPNFVGQLVHPFRQLIDEARRGSEATSSRPMP